VLLKKKSELLYETFRAIVHLSTRLIDANWELSILNTCTCSLALEKTGFDEANLLELVFERMFVKFTDELFSKQEERSLEDHLFSAAE